MVDLASYMIIMCMQDAAVAAARSAAGQEASGEVARLQQEGTQLRNQVEELMLAKIEAERCVAV